MNIESAEAQHQTNCTAGLAYFFFNDSTIWLAVFLFLSNLFALYDVTN